MSAALPPRPHLAKQVAWAALAVFLLAFITLEVVELPATPSAPDRPL